MKQENRNSRGAEIDAWLDSFTAMEPQMASPGFEQRVMDAIRLEQIGQSSALGRVVGSWQTIAAGFAVLLALNLYTAFSIKKADRITDASTNSASVYDATVDMDTYNNYSLLVFDNNH
jgi:hypothetical protein